MDNLAYAYNRDGNSKLINNRLRHVKDAVPNSNGYTTDIKNQPDDNYTYDAIGNLTSDYNAGIANIDWTVYGKVWHVYKGSDTITYTYNTTGQRISKTAGGLTTYYMRDAQGTTLAIYDNAHNTTNWKEQHLYGSSRLGMLKLNANLAYDTQAVFDTVGITFFELDDQKGNVLATISDKRIQYSNNGTTVTNYLADVISAGDSYVFGMAQPGRDYNTLSSRYGLNGQEKDKEIDPSGNIYTAEYWEYDSRLGRRWNLDPKPRVGISDYSTFDDNPILNNDPNGDCPNCVVAAVGAGIGALIGGGIEAGMQLYQHGKITSWKAVGGAALQGGITGGVAGLTGGTSLLVTASASGVANSVGGAVNNAIQGKKITVKSLVIDGTVGAIAGSAGYGANKLASKLFNTASVWISDVSQRGFDIEKILGGNLPKYFPTIDKFKNGVATSIKSIDLNAETYQTSSALRSLFKKYINQVAAFQGAQGQGVKITADQVQSRVLEVAIPVGAATKAQQEVINEAIKYGESNGVKVLIRKLK